MVGLIRAAHMLDVAFFFFFLFVSLTEKPTYWLWWKHSSCLQHLPCSSCLTTSLFIISGRILFAVNIFGCVYCARWWRSYCKMMDRWSWKLITSLIYCRAALKSFNSAWCEIATFFMFRQLVLLHVENDNNKRCSECFIKAPLCNPSCRVSPVLCVRWERLQVSTRHRVHRHLTQLPPGPLQLPSLAGRQRSFSSSAAQRQQQQQPQTQTQTQI